MWTYALVALAAQGAAPPANAPGGDDAPAPIIVEGQKQKPKLVCTTSTVTGSRVGRERRCRTEEEAAQEAVQARAAIDERLQSHRVRQTAICQGPQANPICQ